MRKYSSVIYVLGLIIGLCQISYAAEPASLNQLLAQISTLTADFTQSISNPNQHLTQKSSGKVYLAKPGNLRWEVKKPNPQIIILRKKQLWIYQPDLQQVLIKATDAKTSLENPAIFLTDNFTKILDKFLIKLTYQRSNIVWYQLIPKNENSTYTLIKLGFLNNKLHAIMIDDRLENHITINLKHVCYDCTVPPKIFVLHLPSNTDIINES